MALEPLSRFLSQSVIKTEQLVALSAAAAQFSEYKTLLKDCIPSALYADVLNVSTKNSSLSIAVRSHASATKLYQFQQRVLAHFAANALNFKEIRVFVQPSNPGQTRARPRPMLPEASVAPLTRLIESTKNVQLREALERLRAQAKR